MVYYPTNGLHYGNQTETSSQLSRWRRQQACSVFRIISSRLAEFLRDRTACRGKSACVLSRPTFTHRGVVHRRTAMNRLRVSMHWAARSRATYDRFSWNLRTYKRAVEREVSPLLQIDWLLYYFGHMFTRSSSSSMWHAVGRYCHSSDDERYMVYHLKTDVSLLDETAVGRCV